MLGSSPHPQTNGRIPDGYAVCDPKTGRWASHLTMGVSATPGGSEVFYPGEPMWTDNPDEALTRRTFTSALKLLSKCAYRGVLVELFNVDSSKKEYQR